MKFFAQALFGICLLVFGFVLGVRYQARVESLNEMRTLARVQKAKIDELRRQNHRLHTGVVLRDYLAREGVWLPRETVDDIADSITTASVRYEVPPEMILAVITIESSFDVDALSRKGAVGLMQILPSTAREIARELRMEWPGAEILRDPAANIEMGTYYLTKLIGQFNNIALALAAYNHGPSRIATLAEAKADLPMGYSNRVLSRFTP
ncbi:MAG: lytic transglycosylase domain-containing protein [Acidobacteriota bacterium]